MRKQLLRIMVLCAACLVVGAQAQTSSGGTTPGSSGGTTPGTYPGSSSSSSSQSGLSPTGRMGQHELRASKLMGADVKSSSGDSLGTISDVILNPASGRVDFAIISLSESASSGTSSSASTSGTSATTGSTSSTSTAGKLIPVPWTLLRPSMSGGSSTSTSTSGTEQFSFVFTGDKSKLLAAPSFDQTNWPDMNGPEWRRSIFSHYGVQPGAATGGSSYSPGGSSSGSSAGTSTPSNPDSGSTPPDSGKP